VQEFSKLFRRLREAKGVTCYRLAQQTGLSQQAVLNLEQAGADPKLSTLLKLAAALGVNPARLVPGAETADAEVVNPTGRPDDPDPKVKSTRPTADPGPVVKSSGLGSAFAQACEPFLREALTVIDFGWGQPGSAYGPLSDVYALGQAGGGFRGKSTAIDQEVKAVLRLVREARKYINEINRLSRGGGGNWFGDPEKVRTWIRELFGALGLEPRKMGEDELRAHRRSFGDRGRPWAKMNDKRRANGR
jgi:transcriptional regulator with XRE-family HTH domain